MKEPDLTTIAKQKHAKTTATIWIVESLNFCDENTRKEGEIISRTLRLSERPTEYTYLRTREEFKACVKEFIESEHRYLHISCHGNKRRLHTTTGKKILMSKFADILAPNVKKRRIFFSTCLAVDDMTFAEALLSKSKSKWLSVLGPVGKIDFDDAAIFWSAFYHLMFKADPDKMTNEKVESNVHQCARLVQHKFRLFYKKDEKVISKYLG